MPILTFSIEGQGQTPDGRIVPIPRREMLQQRGPLVQVSITAEQSILEALAQQGSQMPTPISGWALIDTGASVTCLDNEVARKLGLPVVDQVTMTSASHASTQQDVYPVQILISGLKWSINVARAMGATLEPQGIIALIGRDALSSCTLFYNGLTGEVTISI